jgi:uncharacterized membrane-anchored protein
MPAVSSHGGPIMTQAPLHNHPARKLVADEVHARPVVFVPSSGRIRRIAVSLPEGPDAVGRAQLRFAQWCREAGLPGPPGRQHSYLAGGCSVTWELHTEFITLSWMPADAETAVWPQGIGLESLTDCTLLVATRVDLVDAAEVPERLIPTFNLGSLCVSWIEGRTGQIASDFKTDDDGFTRFEFACGGLSTVRRAVLVRRLLEIETYRTYALLGLAPAREKGPELARMESEVARALETMGEVDTVEEARVTLDELHRMSVSAGRLGEATGFRFAATFAYADVLVDRLGRLDEESVGYASTLKRFLRNRIDPAIATCRAFEKRQEALADKLDRAIRLLNTRIGLDVELQSRGLLQGISETGHSQYRLQKTVEGLSTIAISYYAIGILSYVLSGVGGLDTATKQWTLALLVPVVLLLVWLFLRLIQTRHGAPKVP